MNALVQIEQNNVAAYRASTDAAGLCKEIVVATAKNIQGRKYVCVEGWQAIALAHGCTASADNVERVEDGELSGFKAIGIVKRMSDGAEIARGEGFLGDDEQMWAKRPVYARRAMVQTRAISRACRAAFAHVVVMMNAGLSTTPAEEVPNGGFQDAQDAEFSEVATRPVAKDKMEGPFPTKTALEKAVKQFHFDLGKVASVDELEAILGAPQTQALKDQLKRYWPGALTGNGEPEEYESIIDRVNRLRAEMASADEPEEETERTFNPLEAG
jgi:hypothetical protein